MDAIIRKIIRKLKNLSVSVLVCMFIIILHCLLGV